MVVLKVKKAQSGIYAYEIIYKAYGIPDIKKLLEQLI